MNPKDLSEVSPTLEKQLEGLMLSSCDVCAAVGQREVEVYANLYETRDCRICNGTGKRLSKFARELFKGRE